jgi:hypothetical protein
MDAQARKLKASAEMEALTAEASGDQAKQMVPINVEKEKVAVEQKRVNEVLQPELKAKAEFKEISVQLEVKLKEIEVGGEVQKAFAAAMGQSLEGAKLNIFGDPTTMSKMMRMFTRGQGLSNLIEGFTETVDPTTIKMAGDVVSGITDTLADISRRIFGKRVSPEIVEIFAGRVAKDPSIIGKVKDKLAKGIGDIELAAFLSKLFGGDLDLKAAAALIDAFRNDPEALEKIKAAVDKLSAKKTSG